MRNPLFSRQGKHQLIAGERCEMSTQIMKYADVKLGTIEAVFNRLGGVEGAERFLRGDVELVEAKKFLPLDSITITLTQDHNPNEFFQTRPGLWVSDDFRRLVRAKAQPNKAGTSLKLNRAKLAKNLTDSEIEATLPVTHVFTEAEVCAVVATLITEQSEGQEGTLLNNGYANLFYTASCVVDVYWNADDRRWNVSTWTHDDNQWSAENQVFSLATDN